MWRKRLELYDKLVDKCPRFERKGKSMIYTSANGYMFSLMNKAGEIGIRFSEEEKKRFIEEYQTTIYKSYGAIMKGYILIPDKMLKDLDLVAGLMNKSYDYVMSLKPK